MTDSSFTPQEASALTGFSGNIIHRDGEGRAEDCIERALEMEQTGIMVLRGGRLFFKKEGDDLQAWLNKSQAKNLKAYFDRSVLLGELNGRQLLAIPGGIEPDDLGDDYCAIDLRSILRQGLLTRADEGALAQASALLAWHSSHRFCSRCGNPSTIKSGGYQRVCSKCETLHFPRTDPVAIMMCLWEDKCLLGRSPHFPEGMYSALAGFVEPGETIENAVRREINEESSIEVGGVTYHASQPWPFPYSLMIGCYGHALTTTIDNSIEELEDCRWFDKQSVQAMLDGNHPEGLLAPLPGSIAYTLIANWLNKS